MPSLFIYIYLISFIYIVLCVGGCVILYITLSLSMYLFSCAIRAIRGKCGYSAYVFAATQQKRFLDIFWFVLIL